MILRIVLYSLFMLPKVHISHYTSQQLKLSPATRLRLLGISLSVGCPVAGHLIEPLPVEERFLLSTLSLPLSSLALVNLCATATHTCTCTYTQTHTHSHAHICTRTRTQQQAESFT